MNTDILISVMAHLLNDKERDDDDDERTNTNEKDVYNNVVNTFIDMCHKDRDIIHLVSAIFQLCYQSSMSLEHHVWNYQLECPYHDIFKQNIDDIMPSKTSKHEKEYLIKSWADDGKRYEAMLSVYRRTLFARNLRNYLLGTCVLMECYMDCFEVSKMMIHDAPNVVMPMLVNLAKKIEMLMLPTFDRRQSAVELMAWVLQQVRVRQIMCEDIATTFSEDNKDMLDFGKQISYVWKYMTIDREKSQASPSVFDRVSSYVESVIPSTSKKVRSNTHIKHILKKASGDHDGEEADLPENTQQYRTLSLPFNDSDIKLWAVVISCYPRINDPKKTDFSRIELYSYSKTPAKLLIPQGFSADFNNMLLDMAKKQTK